MNFNEYQERATNLNLCPEEFKLLHSILGLVGEAGEVAEKFKKMYRDRAGKMDAEFKLELKKELGDVLWYVSDIAENLGIDLEDVADYNIKKLESRKQRGVLNGSGDNR